MIRFETDKVPAMLILGLLVLFQSSPAAELWKAVTGLATTSQPSFAGPELELQPMWWANLPVIEPTREIPFPGWSVHVPVLSRVGDSFFTIMPMPRRAVNLWALIAYHWPELLGALSAILALAAVYRIRQVMRNPELPGQPHCRSCGYCLTGLTSDRCPECGAPKTKAPRIGRSARRRIAPTAIVASAVCIAYAALWIARVGRTGPFSDWIDWWSEDVLERGAAGRAWFLSPTIVKLGKALDAVVEYDLRTGKERRTITRMPGQTRSRAFGITPDGRFLVMPAMRGDVLQVVRTSDGRVTQRFEIPTDKQRGGSGPNLPSVVWDHVAGFSADGHTLYGVTTDWKRSMTSIVACDVTSGETHELFEAPALRDRASSHTFRQAPRFFLVPGDLPRAVVELIDESRPIPDRPNSYTPAASVVVRDLDRAGSVVLDLRAVFSPHMTPAFSPDGRYMFLQDWSTLTEPARWDLGTGQRTTPMRGTETPGGGVQYSGLPFNMPMTLGPLDHVAYCAQRDQVYVTTRVWENGEFRSTVLVHDQRLHRFIARLECGPKIAAQELIVSPNGKWLAVWGQRNAGNNVTNVMIVYDLEFP